MTDVQGGIPETPPAPVWAALRPLRRARNVPAACFKAFEWLWGLTADAKHPAGKPDHICIAVPWMASEIGRDGRSTREVLTRLEKLGLIDICEKDSERGIWTLYVWRPCPGARRPSRPDLQRRLPILDGSGEGITAQQSPHRGDYGAVIPDPATAGGRQNSPSQPKTAAVESKPAGVTAPRSPRPSMEYIEETSISTSSHRTMDHEGDSPRSAEHPMHITGGLVEALDRFQTATDPRKKKPELMALIKRVVNDPQMDASIPGRAADLVIDGHIDDSRLQQILTDIDQIRTAKRNGTGKGFTTSSGAFFLSWCRKQPGWKEPIRRPIKSQM